MADLADLIINHYERRARVARTALLRNYRVEAPARLQDYDGGLQANA
jgi:hypothetical protein